MDRTRTLGPPLITVLVLLGGTLSTRPAEAQATDPAALVGSGVALSALGGAGLAVGIAFGGPEEILRGDGGEGGGLFIGFSIASLAGGIFDLAVGTSMALGADPTTSIDLGAVTSFVASAILLTLALVVGLDPDAMLGRLHHEWGAAWLALHAGGSLLLGATALLLAHVR